VKSPHRANATLYTMLHVYFAKFSPVAPKVEGRITATDAPQDVLSQLEGYDYEFR
jgi:sulfur-oxidizing protein SoxB